MQGKYAQITNNPENDGCINAVLRELHPLRANPVSCMHADNTFATTSFSCMILYYRNSPFRYYTLRWLLYFAKAPLVMCLVTVCIGGTATL